MDAIKVKNFIILVLLIVNVVLLSTVISDRDEGQRTLERGRGGRGGAA
ncbi:MAG: hypothetical protein ACLTSG_12020 [Lachnospiraceae bacterium]